jgi:hypothetical protein
VGLLLVIEGEAVFFEDTTSVSVPEESVDVVVGGCSHGGRLSLLLVVGGIDVFVVV